MTQEITRATAIFSLVPDADCVDYGDHIIWKNYNEPPVTDEQVTLEVLRLQTIESIRIAKANRHSCYITEADPLFFKAQRGEATMQEWQDKVAEIKARYPI